MSKLADHAQSQPDKVALIDAESSAQLTYGEFNRRSIQCVRLFAAEGLRFGDHIVEPPDMFKNQLPKRFDPMLKVAYGVDTPPMPCRPRNPRPLGTP